ncbi:MAG: PQQ-like beta-propeller repeat protein [Mariniblastus sp.]|nr:PQQ-like beta-propeller repeat protein [Mariniblastus sp.]
MKQKRIGWCLVVALISAWPVNGTFAEDWTQWRGNQRDGTWTETGLVQKFETGSLPVVWRQPISSGYSGPTVAEGRVYVMDRQTEPEQTERVLCFDEQSGEPVWTYQYSAPYVNVGYVAGPRASVTVDGGLAYSLGTMGHLACLDAASGELKWEIDLNQAYSIVDSKRMPIWGIATSPLVYGDQVIVQLGGDDGACIVSFDKKSGKEKWRSLNDRGQYSSPVLAKQNGRDVLVCWTGDSVAGLNPLDGTVYWRHEFKPSRMPIGVATPVIHDNKIFLTSFYDGALMLEMETGSMSVKEVWKAMGPNERQTEGLHSIISTPVWIGDYLYGVDSYGELRCLNAETGKRVWESQEAVPKSRWSTIHFVQNGKQTWMFNERGELILAELSPDRFVEKSRAKLIDPTTAQLRQRNGVCWSHPAFANRCIFVRNDDEIVCINLAAGAK